MKQNHSQRVPPIRVRDLTKTWPGGVEAVRGISFDVEEGEVFGLLGPNGAGKSTTIGMLTTTVLPTSGVAAVHGHDVRVDPVAARAVSAVVFQDAVVDRVLTGRQNLQTHARLWGVPHPQAVRRVDEIVQRLGLADVVDRPVGSYSGGQRRRLEVGRALLSEPRVLFLDEPTVGLDPRIRHELLDSIAALRDRSGMTVVVTTHYLDEAERLCDRIAVIHEGAVVALDSPASLLAAVGEEVLEIRVGDNPLAALETLRTRGIAGPDAFAVGATVTVPVARRATTDLAAQVAALPLRVTAVTMRQPTLDDVYLRLTGASLAAA
jgi:ABC-2 type transport system ATP-binding protein